ncbi:MAG TPA: hypothetical protein VG754_12275 [Verrucomicrobiae bacterium]|nr:hypothetical protein [Verrucomicrobiae bacterium]
MAPKPGYKRGSLLQSAHTNPGNDIAEKSFGIGQGQRDLYVSASFAQANQKHPLFFILQEPFGNNLRVSGQRTKALHGNEFDWATHRFAYGDQSRPIRSAVLVFAIKGAGNDAN